MPAAIAHKAVTAGIYTNDFNCHVEDERTGFTKGEFHFFSKTDDVNRFCSQGNTITRAFAVPWQIQRRR